MHEHAACLFEMRLLCFVASTRLQLAAPSLFCACVLIWFSSVNAITWPSAVNNFWYEAAHSALQCLASTACGMHVIRKGAGTCLPETLRSCPSAACPP